ncbi:MULTISPECIES: alpha/beta hydrolase [unclassified Rhizobium]|uniref:alpha/beta hydrolase n=1 Tax=unclassified Rhizobium TaxID=2613769 RepID=UPI001ADB57EA|nr:MULTISPECIES: alpha/beta hydrolase [unclassified Rhizobium]MBO9100971.1 alpha/beta hydrolase [Rhizobium sp. L58/93]MBO9170741.1 alpha/beta hydrolase [Rhizobium sp. L245/93]MBO9186564.1 alpha/beta hydrolase [Rhizobium sp. E27B/91]QXZ86150.1 alpha/beta hydrolase [Rhizobium sp. K1/93]QXZ92394.1 alpha/beta hydrolase [Rhizobium sp. K15/93]
MPRKIFIVILLLLTGCGHPVGVMTPIALRAVVPGASQVSMLVATTRQPSGNPATLFNGERSPKPYMTDVAVSIPPKRAAGTVQWPQRLPPNPSTDFAVTRVNRIDTVPEGRAWFRAHIEGGHALVFIHGFNNTYEDSVFRLAQIVHDSGMQATPILFTWPSRASLFGYEYDKESTNYSRTALEQSLRVLAADPEVKDITILAHSMGTWLAMESLRQMGIRDGHVNSKIHNVILASPDIDIQVFAKQYVEMGSPKPKFTIFVSQDDRALAASSLITGRVARLGGINPTVEPYRTKLEQGGITAIDLTKVKSNDSMNHGKFAESPEIVQLIGQRLMTGQPLTDSNVSLGEGVAAVVGGTVRTVGTVAETAARAPIMMLQKPSVRKAQEVGDTLQTDPQSQPLTQ